MPTLIFNTEMKKLLIALFAVAGGCRNQDEPHMSAAQPISSPDSAARAAYDDSVVGAAGFGDPGTITTNGDTLKSYGGLVMDIDGARDYSIRQYAKNGIQYVRIAQMTSRTPDGKPVLTVRARLRLPPTASPRNVALEGLCRNNGKQDPFIIAITGPAVDSVSFQATHAWRLDVPTKALHEIPATGVICGYVTGQD